jgi:acetyl esterase/lipase
MKSSLNPGKERRSINFLDNICYSRVSDLEGRPLDLMLSVMVQNGNSEMRIAAGLDDEEDRTKKPLIVWIPGGGFRGCDKNLMVAEMQFLAEAGYALASIYYRSSAQGHYPDQIIDVKTAIRFLRAHAEEYQIDPGRVGVIGRSAGGHLSSMAAVNLDDNISDEWPGYSSDVQACCNLFGPADLVTLPEKDMEEMRNDPDHRWRNIGDTHGGALVGANGPEVWEKLRIASPINYGHL